MGEGPQADLGVLGQPVHHQSTTPPYHHEASNDWKDTVNIPYWEPYTARHAPATPPSASPRRPPTAAGPTARSRWPRTSAAPATRRASVSSTNIATFNDDGLTPDLHTAATGTLAEAVFKIVTPFYITDGYIDGTFFRNSRQRHQPAVRLARRHDLDEGLGEHRRPAPRSCPTLSVRDAGVRQVPDVGQGRTAVDGSQDRRRRDRTWRSRAIFEHNKGGMAYLDKGVNNITVTFDNPQDLASGASPQGHLQVEGKRRLRLDRRPESASSTSPPARRPSPSPPAGTKVPRTEYILMEVTEPPMPDGSAPAPVTNLSVTGTRQQPRSTWPGPPPATTGTAARPPATTSATAPARSPRPTGTPPRR